MNEGDDKPDRIETPSRKMVKHSAAIQKLLEGGDAQPVETQIAEPLLIVAQRIAACLMQKGWHLSTIADVSGNVVMEFDKGELIVTPELIATGTPQEIADRIVAENG